MTIQHLNDSTFEQATADGRVLIDFYADWCGPCKALAPTLQTFAEQNDDIKVAKVNIEDAPALAQRFSVRSIPTLILVEAGIEARRLVGAPTRAVLEDFIAA